MLTRVFVGTESLTGKLPDGFVDVPVLPPGPGQRK